MDILYFARWKRPRRNADPEPMVRPLVPILRIALAIGLIFGIAGVLDIAADYQPRIHADNLTDPILQGE